jgi:hypothetical protein
MWPSLARDVEGVVCAGLRAALSALKHQTAAASASGAAVLHGPGVQQQQQAQQGMWAPARAGAAAQHGLGAKQQAQQQKQQQEMWEHANAQARALPSRSLQVTAPEAVLLNSLQYLMVAVPLAGEALSDLCGSTHGDGDGVGWQIDELVSELRTEFDGALTAAARRLMGAAAQQPGCGLQELVVRPNACADNAAPVHPGAPADAAAAAAQGQQLAPLLAALGEALRWMRALEPRAFVAFARALWDMVGRALHALVAQHSQPSGAMIAAHTALDATAVPWRVRQRADGHARRERAVSGRAAGA